MSLKDQLTDDACMKIKFNIQNTTQTLTVPDVNNFFFAEFTDTHKAILR